MIPIARQDVLDDLIEKGHAIKTPLFMWTWQWKPGCQLPPYVRSTLHEIITGHKVMRSALAFVEQWGITVKDPDTYD